MIDYSYRGQETKDFENILSDYIGAYVACTNTGTSALHLALLLSGIKAYSNIICPSITYVATANAIRYVNANPVFCDVKDDLTIDCEKLDKYLTEGKIIAHAIMPVHVLGRPCDMHAVQKLARKHKLKIIEDSCQALGSFYYGKHCGTIGDFGAISFNGNKIITSGGGGALITKSKRMITKARHLSTVAKANGTHDQLGYNYRMPAWNALLGIYGFMNCDRLKELKEKSKRLKIVYNGWKKIDPEGEKIWQPIHTLPMYKDCLRMDCSNAERIGREVKIK